MKPLGWVLVAVSLFVIYRGVQDFRLSQSAKAMPQMISCAKLGNEGPGDNTHIVLTDMLLGTSGYLLEHNAVGRISKVWLPAVPSGGQFAHSLESSAESLTEPLPTPDRVRVVIKIVNPASEEAIAELGDGRSLRGLVINTVETLASTHQKALEIRYAGADFADSWVVELDREPTPMRQAMSLLGVGVGMAGLGLVLALKRPRVKPAFVDTMQRSDEAPMESSELDAAVQQFAETAEQCDDWDAADDETSVTDESSSR